MRHRIENLIETPETLREKRRIAFTKAQYFCFGVSGAALAGAIDTWWKSGHVAALFFLSAMILGICKVTSCRRRRGPSIALRPIPLPTGGRGKS